MARWAALFIVAPLLLLAACTPEATVRGSGHVVSEERDVHGFTAVSLETLGDMTIVLGDEEGLRIEAEDNILPYLETVVANGTLTIRTRREASISLREPIRYTVTARQLDALAVQSVGSIDAPELRADRFTVRINSVGSIELAGLQASTLDAELVSVGDLRIGGGEVDRQEVTLNSTGSYHAPDLRSRAATVRINSVGSATLWATETLDVRITSTGKVGYYGQPSVTADTGSVGSVESLGER